MSKEFFCLLLVRLVGILCGVEKAYRYSFALMTNSCHPLVDALMPSNATVTRRTIFGRWPVLLILAICCQPQVFKAVVSFVSVYVIKLKSIWDFSKQHDPNDPVKPVRLGFDGHYLVARPTCGTSYGALHHV